MFFLFLLMLFLWLGNNFAFKIIEITNTFFLLRSDLLLKLILQLSDFDRMLKLIVFAWTRLTWPDHFTPVHFWCVPCGTFVLWSSYLNLGIIMTRSKRFSKKLKLLIISKWASPIFHQRFILIILSKFILYRLCTLVSIIKSLVF
jgi:hypothetical protein